MRLGFGHFRAGPVLGYWAVAFAKFSRPLRRSRPIQAGTLVPGTSWSARQGLIERDRHDKLKADLEEIARMISGLINGLDKRNL